MKPPKRFASTGGSLGTGSYPSIGGSLFPGSSGAGGSGSPPPGSTGSTGILWSSLYLY
ncbi:hypothetical protein [Flavobacterium sp. UGB4466]|uniref:hypothetical protein n=1 Tax=Flavobacterium sp. UGB4466 TaxID=2730889 RepID=UPI001ED97D81|nr:hypothetical protein [Flavobacterium sp. UGB4466]